MRVFISGITGFVGSHLASHLIFRGHDVWGSSTRGGSASFQTIRHRFGDPFDARLLINTDAIIHCAHDLTAGAGEQTILGTVAIAEAGRAKGVGTQIFISSYSAHARAVTEYGRTKLKLQEYFLDQGWLAAQPGLVIGKGGIFSTIAEVVRTHRLVPVVYPNAMVPVIAIRDLEVAVARLIEERSGGKVARLYLDSRVTMGHLIREIRRELASPALLVPVPYHAAQVALGLAHLLGIQPPLSRDNLRALHANQGVTGRSDLCDYVPAPAQLAEMIHAAV